MAGGKSDSDRGVAPQMRENSIPPTSDVPVMIVGAGPVGLTLAVGLAKQGIRSVVLEKKPELDEHSRALAVQATTLELLNSYGMVDEFMQAGCFLRHINLHDVDRNKVVLSMSFDEIATETTYPGMLFLPQDRVERLLLDRVLETGLCEVRFGHRFVSYTETSDHVVVSFADSSEVQRTMTASFLVGCDGAHSSIRRVWGRVLVGPHSRFAYFFMTFGLQILCETSYLFRGSILRTPAWSGQSDINHSTGV